MAAALGVAALAGGGALVGVHATQRDDDGFYAGDPAALATPANALVSDDLDVDLDGATWLMDDGRLADLRLSAAGIRDGPVFVGIGPRDDVAAYLRGVPQASADFGADDAGAVVPGDRTPAPARGPGLLGGGGVRGGPPDHRLADGVGRLERRGHERRRLGGRPRGDAGRGPHRPVLWLGIAALVAGGALAAAGTALIVSGRRTRATEDGDDP